MKLTAAFLLLTIAYAACTQRVEYPLVEQPPSQNAINLNTASAEELESLPYIGRRTAEAIIAFREKNGPFRRPEQLLLIRGISESRFLEIRDRLQTK